MHRVETRTVFRSRENCAKCGAALSSSSANKCSKCGKLFCKEHIRSETIGNGAASRSFPVCNGCLSWAPLHSVLAYGIIGVLLLLLLFGVPMLIRFVTR